MRFRFFEYAFFVSAFGTIALLPAASPFIPFLRIPSVAFILTLTSICLVITLGIAWKKTAHKSRVLAGGGALAAGCTSILASIAGQSLPPTFIAWGIAGCIAVLTFGAILARRFFRRVEKDFSRNMGHVMIISLAGNAVLLTLIAFFSNFPPLLAGIVTAAVTFAALL